MAIKLYLITKVWVGADCQNVQSLKLGVQTNAFDSINHRLCFKDLAAMALSSCQQFFFSLECLVSCHQEAA